MISPTELRIGNAFYPVDKSKEVHMPQTGVPFKVLSIGLELEGIPFGKNPAQVERWTKFTPAELSPIPLTPEILKACGYINEGDETIIGKGLVYRDWPYYWCADSFYIFVDTNDNSSSDIEVSNIRYLHKLQNIVFALTGEDLPITIPGIATAK